MFRTGYDEYSTEELSELYEQMKEQYNRACLERQQGKAVEGFFIDFMDNLYDELCDRGTEPS